MNVMGDGGVYHHDGLRSPSVDAAIESVTAPKNWDYPVFKQALIACAFARRYIPAHHRPDSVHLQGLGDPIEQLALKTQRSSHEWGRGIFADIGKKSFVLGPEVEGTEGAVALYLVPQPGRELVQIPVGTIHTHPPDVIQFGFSTQDYITLLANDRHQFFIMRCGPLKLMTLKTSATPNNMKRQRVEERLSDIKEDFLRDSAPRSKFLQNLANFNKQVCTEFGLTLYSANERARDLLERVPVTV